MLPRWTSYVLLPATRSVCAQRVAIPLAQSAAALTGAGALTCAGRGSAAIARGTPTKLILDFGREMSGYLELRFAAGSIAGAASVAFSESLAYLGDECDRLGVEGLAQSLRIGMPACPRAVALTGGAQAWRDPAERSGFRYVLLTLTPAQPGGAIRLAAARVGRYTPLPQYHDLRAASVYRGWFLSSDDAFNRYWYDGAYTAQVDTIAAGQAGVLYEGIAGLAPASPVIVDGAKRDRYVWYDLAGPKVLIPLLYGDAMTPRDTLRALGERQAPDGFIPACRPPASFYGAPCATAWTDATGWWVIALGEYALWSGDASFAAAEYPIVGRALDALEGCRAAGALIAGCNGRATYDGGEDPSPSTYLNAVHYGALRAAAQIARMIHRPREAVAYERAAARVRMAIDARLWDAAAGAYACSLANRGCHAQDANVLPVVWGIADGRRAREALGYVKRHLWTRFGTRTGSPGMNLSVPVDDLVAGWISYFEMQARIDTDQTADVRSMMNSAWGYMYSDWKQIPGPQGDTEEPPSTTAWEHPIATTGAIFRGAESSLAHVWSAGATIIETTGLLGVEPLEPGFSKWRLAPHARGSGLGWAQGTVPTPHGPLRAWWRISGSQIAPHGLTLGVSAPSGTRGVVYVPLYGHARRVSEDGVPVAGGRAEGDYLRVSATGGRHTFSWGG